MTDTNKAPAIIDIAHCTKCGGEIALCEPRDFEFVYRRISCTCNWQLTGQPIRAVQTPGGHKDPRRLIAHTIKVPIKIRRGVNETHEFPGKKKAATN